MMEDRLKEKGILPTYYGAGADHYDFTKEDIDKLGELTDVDMFCLKKLVDQESMNQVYQLMDYEGQDDYLKKNGFVNSKGETDYQQWQDKFLLAMDKMYQEDMNSKGVSK